MINQTLESALLQANILQNVKQDLLEEFQTAAALHIGLQKLAGIINEMLDGEWNVLWRVMQLSTFHDIEREWTDSDLDVFISGLMLIRSFHVATSRCGAGFDDAQDIRFCSNNRISGSGQSFTTAPMEVNPNICR